MAQTDALNFLKLFTPTKTKTTQTTKTSTSKEAVKAATDKILQSLIPNAAGDMQASGGFNSSIYALAAADAAAKSAAYAEELNKTTTNTQTQTTPAAIDPKLGMALWAGNALLESDWGKKKKTELSDFIFGSGGDTNKVDAFTNLNLFNSPSGSVASDTPGFFDSLIKFIGFADGGLVGDPQKAYEEMLKVIQGRTDKSLSFENVIDPAARGSSAPLPQNDFAGYGDKVIRDTGKELGMAGSLGLSLAKADPLGIAASIGDFTKYDAQMRLLQGIGEDDPDKINAAVSDLESAQVFGNSIGLVSKAKGIKDSLDGFSQLADIAQQANTLTEKTLVGAIGAQGAIKSARDLSDLASGASSLLGAGEGAYSSSGGKGDGDFGGLYNGNITDSNWSMNSLYSDPTKSSESGFADGGFLGGQFRSDFIGKDKIPARLSGGEFVIPSDVVSMLSPQFFERLINNLHKQV